MESVEDAGGTGRMESGPDAKRMSNMESMSSIERTVGMESRSNTERTVHVERMADTERTEDLEGKDTGDMEGKGYTGDMRGKVYTENMENTERPERESNRERRGGMKNTVKRKTLTGSFAAKVVAFFLLALSAASAVAGSLFAIYLVSEDYYNSSLNDLFLYECSGAMLQDVHAVRDYIAMEKPRYAMKVCEGKNIDIGLLQGDLSEDNGSATDNPDLIWTTYKGEYEITLTEDVYLLFPDSLSETVLINRYKIDPQEEYVFRVYFNMDFPENDRYAEIYNGCSVLYSMRYIVLWIVGLSIFIGFNSFLFLMCSAGRRNDAEGIQPSVFFSIPLDLYTAFYGIVALFLLLVTGNTFSAYGSMIDIAAVSVAATAEALWCTFYLRELAVRMKLGDWWKNTVIYYVLRMLRRIFSLLRKGICVLLREISSILGILICFAGISILEFLVTVLFGVDSDLILIWMIEKVILFPAIVYIAVMCERLLNGSRALAEGRQEEMIDTSHMFGDFKECGENLNNIGQGISRAVAERMKSEHLKTELITNVSHDIKTPLTSIINYANLIAEEPTENKKITEYSEVLVRQSGRMKKLLEDLLEASKATTGNLEVDLQPCEVSVILSQAIGEYQQRMEEKQLELIVTQPEQAVNIMADGRHLWRVFDNLLNNICKYAREDSRVYLNVEVADRKVSIIFRNMSKYVLNILPEELQERFVRGDRSRHMDGNGLGLSIARSLTDLQNGQMEIVTDGDLFKVILIFEELVK